MPEDIFYKVGRHTLVFPADHMMPRYQAKWLRYDTALAYIARMIFSKYPRSSAVDIGANIGDSAALIQEYQSVPTLCIEGNPEFIGYLEKNSDVIGNIVVECLFVGENNQSVDLEKVRSQGGTSSIVQAVGSQSEDSVRTESLVSILDRRSSFKGSKLLKIDTDGFDFFIIQSSIDTIKSQQPIIFFEYDILLSKAGVSGAKKTIEALIGAGYTNFAVYDNFGNYMLSFSYEQISVLDDLNAYLLSSRLKSGTPSIYYYDFCAFPEKDSDVFDSLRQLELQF